MVLKPNNFFLDDFSIVNSFKWTLKQNLNGSKQSTIDSPDQILRKYFFFTRLKYLRQETC